MTTLRVAVLWRTGPARGIVRVTRGSASLADGGKQRPGQEGKADLPFALDPHNLRLELEIDAEHASPGAFTTRVTILEEHRPFTFFPRDVRREAPILIPVYGVAVTEASDSRTYDEILDAIRSRGLLINLQRLQSQPEVSYPTAAARTRAVHCPTWLGLGRDMRIFEVGLRTSQTIYDSVQPRFHANPVPLAENGDKPCRFDWLLGRGWGCTEHITRRLDGGQLPILHQTVLDDDIRYDTTAFVTLEKSALVAGNVRGTDYLVADGHSAGHRFTDEQQRRFAEQLPEEMNASEETVFCLTAVAVNTAAVPRYAFVRAPFPTPDSWHKVPHHYEDNTGLGVYASGRVFCVGRLDGAPLPQDEMSILLQPGQAATFTFMIPHRPLPRARAESLAARDSGDMLEQCRAYWSYKLASAAQISLPEGRIEEMLQAGLLHLDLISYGREPGGPLAVTIGIYSPIGSESAAIIQFMDSMGWHSTAERAIDYFIAKQHPNGFMQNFDTYMLETGCVLWTMGEHYRYTRDETWAARVRPAVLKACQYLIDWHERNRREELRGRGYGLVEGKVGDPEDAEGTRVFMMNGFAALGLTRAAELLAAVDPEAAIGVQAEADKLHTDLRTAFLEALGQGPVVPLGDGTWVPTVSGWPGYPGFECLYAEGGHWTTHGAVTCRDSLAGPLWLVPQEIVAPHESAATFMLLAHNELLCSENVAFSQPYYSQHPWLHLRRDEVKPFLAAYYHGLASLADRETYSFWEHFFHASPHKTEEEAWFLMQSRWMLYMEEGDTLHLLRGIPRAWLADGKRIACSGLASYFGRLSMEVTSDLRHERIRAIASCPTDRGLQRLRVRLPHPDGRRAVAVEGGTYDAITESVTVEAFSGHAEITVRYS
ncbi:MAG: glucosidase family protein [Anaerolineae bacterium]